MKNWMVSFDTATEISSGSGSSCSEWLLSGQNRLSRPIQQSVFRRMTSGEFTEVERSLLMLLYHHRGSWIVSRLDLVTRLVTCRGYVISQIFVQHLFCYDSDDNGNFWLIGAPTNVTVATNVINLTNQIFTYTFTSNHSVIHWFHSRHLFLVTEGKHMWN